MADTGAMQTGLAAEMAAAKLASALLAEVEAGRLKAPKRLVRLPGRSRTASILLRVGASRMESAALRNDDSGMMTSWAAAKPGRWGVLTEVVEVCRPRVR